MSKPSGEPTEAFRRPIEDLIRKADNEQKFDDFFAANFETLLADLRRRGAPSDLAERVAKFAFMVMKRRWNDLEPDNLVGYVNTVARNKLKKEIGPYLKRLDQEEKAAIAALSEAHTHGDDIEISSTMKKLLDDLAPRLRQAIVLRHLRGFGIQETAEIMRVSQGAVKRYTHDGLRSLNSAITEMQDVKRATEDGTDDR